MSRAGRVAWVIGGVIALFAAYEVFTSFVAYTSDAYVRSDLIAVAPQVTGRIVAVHVTDNQPVKQGDPLVTIDPVPFQLVIAQRAADIDQARAQAAADQDETAAAQDRLQAAQAALTFAQQTRERVAALVQTSDVSRQSLDQANDDARRAEAARSAATAAVAAADLMHAMHVAALARAEAQMAFAQWQLARTHVAAPADGTINNLTVRAGDTATENTPLIGIIDAHAWRVIANYKQDYLRNFTIGGTAWVWLDSHPWHMFRARIASIGRGISRDEAEAKLLPYVAPTTDWIRLQRRFPVTLTLVDPPPDLHLLMGADARTVIFP
jgi:multidrug efflux system membrane fusion protein